MYCITSAYTSIQYRVPRCPTDRLKKRAGCRPIDRLFDFMRFLPRVLFSRVMTQEWSPCRSMSTGVSCVDRRGVPLESPSWCVMTVGLRLRVTVDDVMALD